MTPVYSQEKFPETIVKTLYLAGPSPRKSDDPNWRTEALGILEKLGYDGHVFIPLPRDGKFPSNYDAQFDWEQEAMNRSDVVLFWIPRDLLQLPAFTTNVEWGQKCRNRNVVLGYPSGSPKNTFLGCLAKRNFVDQSDNLKQTIQFALDKIGTGAERHGGECEVPLYLWRLTHFQSWLMTQKAAGNRLDSCHVELSFGVGSRKAFLFYWAAHVDIWVASENRHKNNEIVIGRPDIKHIVGYVPGHILNPANDEANPVLDAKIILVREFRSTASTTDGFIREVPGGSGFKPVAPEVEAVKEFFQETGLSIVPERLRTLPTRQLAGTTTSHKAYVFALELTPAELVEAQQKAQEKRSFGNRTETELTYIEVRSVRELLAEPLTDWSNLGFLFATLAPLINEMM